jgi:dTDP-D-glucose 4,6-dehydratase
MKDVDIVLPSLEISKSILGWEPKINIEDGLKRTVQWYKEYEKELRDINFKYEYEK